MAGLFLCLHARRFSGLAYVRAQARTITFAFRAGVPVLIEESAPEASLADELVERGLLSRAQYAAVIARVTEDLVDNEDVAFCEHAVSLGYLSQDQVKAELSERVRSKLIQAMSLRECRVELDEAADLSGLAEYPQRLGAAVYMGVRTFYEEELLASYVPDLRRHYMRLLKAPAEIARFFELDYEEVALLNTIDPRLRANDWFEDCDLEPAHALQLLALLVIARMCEFNSNAFVSPEVDRSGVRSATRPDSAQLGTRAAQQAVRDVQNPRPGSRNAMPAVREELFEPRSAQRVGLPAVPPGSGADPGGAAYDPRVEQASNPDSAGVAHDPRAEPASRAAAGGSRDPARSAARDAAPQPMAAGAGRAVESARKLPAAAPSPKLPEPAAKPREPAATPAAPATKAAQPAAQPEIRQPKPAPVPAVVTTPTAQDDAAAQALAEVRARSREGRRGSAYAAQRLGRELEAQRLAAVPTPAQAGSAGSRTANPGAPQTREQSPPTASGPVPATPDYQKAHLRELLNRRPAGTAAEPILVRKEPPRELRHAQELLRDGQFTRAEEQLRGLVERTPGDETLRAYLLWSQLRASHNLDAAQLASLRDLAKKLVSNQEHGGFGCYVLAHLYLADKKDDQAEKYFRKAHQLDKTNKDAERHVVILERRKHQGPEAETGSPRKIFGISFNKPKGE